jgi:protein involved in polysaccharide export with SLBB domain
VLAVLTAVGSLSAQVAPSWDASRFQVSRAELQALLEEYDALASSPAYSGAFRDDARDAASQIRERLEVGDFRVGDRIVLDVRGEDELPDTVQVQPGPVIVLGDIGEISLAGVLRSELQAHLVRELSRVIREPVVYSQSMIRLSVDGEIGTPGFHVLPAELLLGEVLMRAGGLAEDADMDRIRVLRGETVLLDESETAQAIIDGRSLDQLSMRAGDRIEVGAQPNRQIWGSVLRIGVGVLGMLLLGIRVF